MRKSVLFAVICLVVFVFSGCSEPAPASFQVKYEIAGTLTGGSETVMAQYITAGGGINQQTVSVPWMSDTYTMKAGETAMLQGVFSADTINVTLKIYKDGSVVKTGNLNTTSMGSVSVQQAL